MKTKITCEHKNFELGKLYAGEYFILPKSNTIFRVTDLELIPGKTFVINMETGRVFNMIDNELVFRMQLVPDQIVLFEYAD